MRLLQRVLLWSLTLLAVATVGLWCRSYSRSDSIQFQPRQRSNTIWFVYLNSNRGVLRFSRSPYWVAAPRKSLFIESHQAGLLYDQKYWQDEWRDCIMFDSWARRVHTPIRGWTPDYRLPHAAIAIPAGLAAFLLYRRERSLERRRRRLLLGGCPACGYDLTGNLSGTCPECGLKIPVSA